MRSMITSTPVPLNGMLSVNGGTTFAAPDQTRCAMMSNNLHTQHDRNTADMNSGSFRAQTYR